MQESRGVKIRITKNEEDRREYKVVLQVSEKGDIKNTYSVIYTNNYIYITVQITQKSPPGKRGKNEIFLYIKNKNSYY